MELMQSPLETYSAVGYDCCVPGGERFRCKELDNGGQTNRPSPFRTLSLANLHRATKPIIPRSAQMKPNLDNLVRSLQQAEQQLQNAVSTASGLLETEYNKALREELHDLACKVSTKRMQMENLRHRGHSDLETDPLKVGGLARKTFITPEIEEKSQAAMLLGRKGGLASKGKTSDAKKASSRDNGAKGGRPPRPHKYPIGTRVVEKRKGKEEYARIIEHLPEYPSQRWYKIRFDEPDLEALAVDEFPDNAWIKCLKEKEIKTLEQWTDEVLKD